MRRLVNDKMADDNFVDFVDPEEEVAATDDDVITDADREFSEYADNNPIYLKAGRYTYGQFIEFMEQIEAQYELLSTKSSVVQEVAAKMGLSPEAALLLLGGRKY